MNADGVCVSSFNVSKKNSQKPINQPKKNPNQTKPSSKSIKSYSDWKYKFSHEKNWFDGASWEIKPVPETSQIKVRNE